MERNETIRTVERAKTGDKRAFALLYRENYDKIYRYVLKNVGRPDAAEDITQEVFLQSMQNIGRLEKNENYAAWLRGMAHNKCADMFRSESRFTYYETDEELENAVTYLCTGFKSNNDSIYRMVEYYLAQSTRGTAYTPEQVCEIFRSITRQQVIDCAKTFTYDTFYVMQSQQEASEDE
jgi:RNA polymerase sigma factor (sigma-70 family)